MHKTSIISIFLDDFLYSIKNWRIAYILGIGEIKKRYIRSRIGQFWLTLSLVIHICALGFLWAFLFKIRVAEYLPYLAFGIVFWNCVSNSLIEGTVLYPNHTGYIKELNLPKMLYINSLLVKHLIMLLHNIPVLIVILFLYVEDFSITRCLLSLLGFIMTIILLYPSVAIFTILGVRFRDVYNIVVSFLQIVFFLTPVMWKTDLIPEKLRSFLIFNPFSILLSLCRDPILNIAVPFDYWLIASAYILFAWMLFVLIFGKYQSKIVYWL